MVSQITPQKSELDRFFSTLQDQSQDVLDLVNDQLEFVQEENTLLTDPQIDDKFFSERLLTYRKIHQDYGTTIVPLFAQIAALNQALKRPAFSRLDLFISAYLQTKLPFVQEKYLPLKSSCERLWLLADNIENTTERLFDAIRTLHEKLDLICASRTFPDRSESAYCFTHIAKTDQQWIFSERYPHLQKLLNQPPSCTLYPVPPIPLPISQTLSSLIQTEFMPILDTLLENQKLAVRKYILK